MLTFLDCFYLARCDVFGTGSNISSSGVWSAGETEFAELKDLIKLAAGGDLVFNCRIALGKKITLTRITRSTIEQVAGFGYQTNEPLELQYSIPYSRIDPSGTLAVSIVAYISQLQLLAVRSNGCRWQSEPFQLPSNDSRLHMELHYDSDKQFFGIFLHAEAIQPLQFIQILLFVSLESNLYNYIV